MGITYSMEPPPPPDLNVSIIVESPPSLLHYGQIPIAFEVREQLVVEAIDGGLGGLALRAVPVKPFYTKDYDALPGQAPRDWPKRWNIDRWRFLAAFVGRRRVGGATVILPSEDIDGLAGRADEAILWDLRIVPDLRHHGIGRRLLEAAEEQARKAGKKWMKVETQTINTPACRLYARAGYTLRAIDRSAYPELPKEGQLIWTRPLGDDGRP